MALVYVLKNKPVAALIDSSKGMYSTLLFMQWVSGLPPASQVQLPGGLILTGNVFQFDPKSVANNVQLPPFVEMNFSVDFDANAEVSYLAGALGLGKLYVYTNERVWILAPPNGIQDYSVKGYKTNVLQGILPLNTQKGEVISFLKESDPNIAGYSGRAIITLNTFYSKHTYQGQTIAE